MNFAGGLSGRGRTALCGMAVLVAAVAVSGCRGATSAAPDTAPGFSATVADQTYTVGEAVSFILPEASGGNGPLSYSLEPHLPPGLRFDRSSRTLSGSPAVAGTYPLTYRVVDGDANTEEGDSAALTFTIAVRSADTAPSFPATVADQVFIEGTAVALVLPEASGGNGALSHSLTPEVPGLTFDMATRMLSGRPTVADTYSMTYTAADGDDNAEESDEATLTFTITVEPDTAPSFAVEVEDRSYTIGDVVEIVLPEAGGGNGALSYSLTPEVPGLTFDMATRMLSGSPTVADTYPMTYTAVDSDNNTTASDAGVVTFDITIDAPEGILDVYGGSGNEVYLLNPDAGSLEDTPYTLLLGEAAAEVYLVATNTTDSESSPYVELVGGARSVTEARPRATEVRRRSASDYRGHTPARVTEFNNNPPRLYGAAAAGSQQSPPAVADGDTFTFQTLDDFDNLIEIPATARSVLTEDEVTLAVWVADADWGNCTECVRQVMVDGIADRFLQPGSGNDIYDWTTAIFDAPWGPHDRPDLIPAEYGSQIHILIYDIDDDGLAPGGSRRGGYHWAKDNYWRNPRDIVLATSNERLMFYLDAPLLTLHHGSTWNTADPAVGVMISTLVHEFQHMIHFYQKEVVHDALSEAWLNEMSSWWQRICSPTRSWLPGLAVWPMTILRREVRISASADSPGTIPKTTFSSPPGTVWMRITTSTMRSAPGSPATTAGRTCSVE